MSGFVFVRSLVNVLDVDLVDMLQRLAKKSSGVRYILIVIDVSSNYGLALTLKNDNGPEVSHVLYQGNLLYTCGVYYA